MIETLTLILATPIAKAILDKFYESVGSKLGEKAVELVPEKVKQLGQIVWDKCLKGDADKERLLERAANGSAEAQQELTNCVHKSLGEDNSLQQNVQPLVTEIVQVIQNKVDAKNVQQIFSGQGLMVTEKQEQPIIQVQGNPVFNFGTQKSD